MICLGNGTMEIFQKITGMESHRVFNNGDIFFKHNRRPRSCNSVVTDLAGNTFSRAHDMVLL